MPSENIDAAKKRLKRALEERGFVRGSEADRIAATSGRIKEDGWLFDVKNILLEPLAMKDIADIFWDSRTDTKTFQIGGLETAGIPIVAALIYSGATEHRRTDVTGFIVRKSRKKDGLMKFIEGLSDPKIPVILVDDLINDGSTKMREIAVLEAHGCTVSEIWTVVRFRDMSYYKAFEEKGIRIRSIFELNDFSETLDTANMKEKGAKPYKEHFKTLWKFSSMKPNLHFVIAKSDPILDESRVYVGSDSGTMWALNQSDGSVAWSFKIGPQPLFKGIFSSPAISGAMIFFGGYDGNFYALDKDTGKKRWMCFEADWIGSSPAIAEDLGLVFVGLEFGLFRKRGGIVAIDIKTGKKRWGFSEMPCFTHSSPLYIRRHRQVVIGSNDGAAYLFDAATGALVWKFDGGVLTEKAVDSGFSEYDVKESFAYDERRDMIIFGNTNGSLWFVDRRSGKSVGEFKAEFGFYSTPVIYKDTVLASSVDKNLYCVGLDTFAEKWRWNAGARIFATPVVIGESVYIGSNTGKLVEFDPETGAERSFALFSERITNRVVFNPTTRRFFVPTFANELYCIERIEPAA